ncbi:MAG: PIN domain-containing protein [Limisphaerales bacterium]
MYLDTGILVKLLTPEPETMFFERELQGHALVSSELAHCRGEIGIVRQRTGGVWSQRHNGRRRKQNFVAMIADEIFKLGNLNNQTLRKATQIIQACHPKVPLRALDALHVATCDLAQEFPVMHDRCTDARAPPAPCTFRCFQKICP